MLCINNLSCGYDSNLIIDDISFEILFGEKVFILGPNGCGKTTLLKAITGLIEYSGSILLDGVDLKTISRKEYAKKIAYMSQISSIYFSYTVFETVMLGRYASIKKGIFSEYSQHDIDYVNNCIDIVGMTGFKEKSIMTLSGGELQRVLLARVFAQNPDVIILDEPTNHLDLRYQIELIDYLKKWCINNNKIVIGVLHDINLGLSFADKIILLSSGKIVIFDNALDLIKSSLLNELYGINIKNYMKNFYKIWNI